MDLINNRTREIAGMALDGLYERSKAISTNTANALTPGYQRKEVLFEDSLRNIIKREDEKEQIKLQNSIEYMKNPKSNVLAQSPEKLSFLNSQIDEGYFIDVESDMAEPYGTDGNNVNLETEMMDEAENGMRYQVVAGLLSKSYQNLANVIKGQNS